MHWLTFDHWHPPRIFAFLIPLLLSRLLAVVAAVDVEVVDVGVASSSSPSSSPSSSTSSTPPPPLQSTSSTSTSPTPLSGAFPFWDGGSRVAIYWLGPSTFPSCSSSPFSLILSYILTHRGLPSSPSPHRPSPTLTYTHQPSPILIDPRPPSSILTDPSSSSSTLTYPQSPSPILTDTRPRRAQYLFGGKPTDARKACRAVFLCVSVTSRSPWQSVDLVAVRGLSTSSEGSQQTLARRAVVGAQYLFGGKLTDARKDSSVVLFSSKVYGLGLGCLELGDIDIDLTTELKHDFNIDLTTELKHDVDTELQRASRPVPWYSVDLVVVQGL
ncbi:uncharacterized protein STEHIDRAFT_154350 [Stereum hirsutum FP-91666 SS1]|uniref:uncharacterized protein n=1 Tax=Stereum hirsutum (strain FP-91666) TaxID=721885 RepID=UPI000440BB4D|nr:uncharacterized protein STEHIDRAFT_154350 [Stereum hirsutum FP-91666 SS1]EIM90532.1 hypothetical protein STEHIDRAFT_154350 [Stereum hirsutum FP-91666 SS1]